MPTYAYKCDACEHEFDEFQKMSDDPLTKCPKCKKNKLRRLISAGAALLFKGSGFYETDYRSESYKSAAKADADKAAPKTDSEGGKSGTTDTGSAGKGKKSSPDSSKSPS
jgi:putative FmdB family regulatory protein